MTLSNSAKPILSRSTVCEPYYTIICKAVQSAPHFHLYAERHRSMRRRRPRCPPYRIRNTAALSEPVYSIAPSICEKSRRSPDFGPLRDEYPSYPLYSTSSMLSMVTSSTGLSASSVFTFAIASTTSMPWITCAKTVWPPERRQAPSRLILPPYFS